MRRSWALLAGPAAALLAGAPARALAQVREGSEAPRPQVERVEPAAGPPGTRVTIHGLHFQPGATVELGGAEAEVERITDDRIVAVVGPHRPGRVAVTVTNPRSRSGTRGWAFTYERAVP